MRASLRHLLLAIAMLMTIAAPVLFGGATMFVSLGALTSQSLATIVAIAVLSWFARAAKLWLLTRRLGLALQPPQALAVSLATEFAFLSTPAGLGGYAAGVLLLRRVGATTPTATAVAAADQIVDALFFALALPIAALIAARSGAPRGLLQAALAGGALIALGALVAIAARRWIAHGLARVGTIPTRRPRTAVLRDLLAHAARPITLLLCGNPRYALCLAMLTTLQWTTRYGVLWVALAALGHDVPYSIVMLVQALVMHAAQWTGMPAGAGTAEFGLAAALSPWISTTTLAPAILLWRFATLHLALLAGGLAMLQLVRPRRGSGRAGAAKPTPEPRPETLHTCSVTVRMNQVDCVTY
jgi:uncharacterized protein (TIRG00374 family)